MLQPRLVKQLLIVLSTVLLSSCLHLQLGGPTTETTVTTSPLRQPNQVIEQRTTPTLEQARQEQGADTWDEATDQERMNWMGNVEFTPSEYQDNALYLAVASGGEDQDANTDLNIDTSPAEVFGSWHAIITGAQLEYGNVSVLTEAIYRYLELDLDELSDQEVKKELDKLARRVVTDVDGNDKINYEDVMLWVRHYNPDTYIRDLDNVDELAEAIRDNAPADEIRGLSRRVLGYPASDDGNLELSGTITVTTATRVDSDVNDPDAEFIGNNNFGKAQEIIAPVVLGGYVNEPGTGFIGRSQGSGDKNDYYRVELLEDQLITLVMMAQPLFTDLDLYLYDADRNMVDSSVGLDRLEQLRVPADGIYFVRVTVVDAYSNYRLSIGFGQELTNTNLLRLSGDFIPGEIVARFDDNNPAVSTMAARAKYTQMQVQGEPGRANLLRLPEKVTAAGNNLQRKLETLLAIKELRKSDTVVTADPNYYVYPTALPTDILYDQQAWHYEQIKLPAAWDKSLGEGVIVAVVDSGVRLDHPDLQGQLVAGYDFVSSRFISNDGDGIDSDPTDPGDSNGFIPSTFHGTHVSGTIAAASNNLTGVAGVAWEAKIMPLRALGNEFGSSYDVLQAVRYAAGLRNDSRELPERPADVINLSLGGGYSSTAERLYEDIADLGIIVIAAAGNDDTSVPSYPAGYDDVISVSATNINRELASYSNFGNRIAVAAPGGDSQTDDVNGDGFDDMVLSTAADDTSFFVEPTYTLLQGTSMACPHMADVAALMKSVYPELDQRGLETLLASGDITDDLGEPGRDNQFGWGLINANKAVLMAQSLASGEDVEDLPSLFVNPSLLNFGTATTTLELLAANGGTGELTVNSVSANDAWLDVSAEDVDGDGQGTYLVSVYRDQLSVGLHSSTVSVSSSEGDSEVQVIVRKADPADITSGDAGLQHVVLVDADRGRIEQQVSVLVENGQYEYQFTGVPAGNYRIVAGSDMDSDFSICDAGEACGAWPVRDGRPTVLQAEEDRDDLDFSTTFSTGIISRNSLGGSQEGYPRTRYGVALPEPAEVGKRPATR